MKYGLNQKNSEVITLLVKPSEKDEIKELADYLGIGMNAVLKVAFKTYKRQLFAIPEFEPTDRTIKSIRAARSGSDVRTNGKIASKVLDEITND